MRNPRLSQQFEGQQQLFDTSGLRSRRPDEMTPDQWLQQSGVVHHASTRVPTNFMGTGFQANPSLHVGTEQSAVERVQAEAYLGSEEHWGITPLRLDPDLGDPASFAEMPDEGENWRMDAHVEDTGRAVRYQNIEEDAGSTSYAVPGWETHTYAQDLRKSPNDSIRQFGSRLDRLNLSGAPLSPQFVPEQGTLYPYARANRSFPSSKPAKESGADHYAQQVGDARPQYEQLYSSLGDALVDPAVEPPEEYESGVSGYPSPFIDRDPTNLVDRSDSSKWVVNREVPGRFRPR